MKKHRPLIVGIGGSNVAGSTSETALRMAMDFARGMGAEIEIVTGPGLVVPPYNPSTSYRSPEAGRIVELFRAADGILISSPSYHGSISGLIKNVLDYAEDMRGDPEPYFEGRSVGCIVCAHGALALGTTVVALRSIVHALRGWPTPYGAAINSAAPEPARMAEQLKIIAAEVMDFAQWRVSRRTPVSLAC